MGLLGQLLARLLGARPAEPTNWLPLGLMWAAAALLLVLAIAFAAVALALALAPALGWPAAVAIVAGVLLLIALILIVILLLRQDAKPAPAAEGELLAELALKLGQAAGDALPLNKSTVMMAALLAGVAVGASPGLRRWLRGLIG